MQKLTLIHWKPAEAADRAQRLRDLGYAVRVHSNQGSHTALREDASAAFVIDLVRLPSHGREIGGWLRRQVSTRGRPLVFVGGKADNVELVRTLLPDATFTDWEAIAGDLPAAIANPPAKPVVPGTMAGYSGAPLPKKLGIRAQDLVLLIDATWSGLCFARQGSVKRRGRRG